MSLTSKGLGVALLVVAAGSCLGRSSLDDPDLVLTDAGADVTAGSGGSISTGGAGGKAGRGGSGGAAASGGAAGAAALGGGGSGGTGGTPACENCAGCCDAAGTCRAGDAVNACGRSGGVCLDCGALGFGCIDGACEGPPPPCASTCAGCCEAGGLCRFGTQSDACGANGAACQDCAALGQGCVSARCQGPPPACGPANCGGCCEAGACRTGRDVAACGAGGITCQNCSSAGRICNQPGSYCAFIPTCGAVTCPSGCCDAQGNCRSGRTDAECGSTGQRCVDCTSTAQACAPQGFCYNGTHCGADNCGGCCTATGSCGDGSTSAACGQFGVLCDNCTTKNQTCQNRVCSGSTTCPAPYPGCNPALVTTPPFTSSSCTAAELSALEAQCAGQNPGAACEQALNALLADNPTCYDCMLQFLAVDQSLVKCLAPYLSSSCNHDLSCALECSNQSCGQCGTGEQQCRDQVFQSGGQCQTWVNGAFCLQAALGGPGAFCNFNQDVGAWLRTVGSHYCGG